MPPFHETAPRQHSALDFFRHRAAVLAGTLTAALTVGLTERVANATADQSAPQGQLSPGIVAGESPFEDIADQSAQTATTPGKVTYTNELSETIPGAHTAKASDKIKFYSGVESKAFNRELNKRKAKCLPAMAYVNPYFSSSKRWKDHHSKNGRLWLENTPTKASYESPENIKVNWTYAKGRTWCTAWALTLSYQTFFIKPDKLNSAGGLYKDRHNNVDPKGREIRAVYLFFKNRNQAK